MRLLERSALYASVIFAIAVVLASLLLGGFCLIDFMTALIDANFALAIKRGIQGCILTSALAVSAAYLVQVDDNSRR